MIKLDAAPLIYALKANLIPILKKVYKEIVITQTVFHEVVTRGKEGRHRDAFVAEKLIEIGDIIVHEDAKQELELGLGPGETATIASALEERGKALLEDMRAVRTGLRLGLNVEFLSIALLKAYQTSIITEEEFNELFENYCQVAGVSVIERYKTQKIKEVIKK